MSKKRTIIGYAVLSALIVAILLSYYLTHKPKHEIPVSRDAFRPTNTSIDENFAPIDKNQN